MSGLIRFIREMRLVRKEMAMRVQRRACRALIDDEERLYRAVEQANSAFYNELVLGNWRRQELEAHPEDEAVILREMPDVDDPSLLWKWLTDPSLHVPNQEGDGWVVELFWDCRWDEEHGHRVAIRDGEVTTDVDE